MYDIVTLAEVKQFMKISDTSHDTVLADVIEDVTKMIENYTGKVFITRQFVEYYDGRLLNRFNLKNYPIYCIYDDSESPEEPSNITVYDDSDREFDSDNLIDASDLLVWADEGMIGLYGDESIFTNAKQNVKVTYYAGYSRFHVVDEQNNYLDVKEAGDEVAIEITPAVIRDTDYPGFSAEDLATAIQTALNASEGLSNTYTITYSHKTQKFKISATGNFTLENLNGTNKSKTIADLIGFSLSTDTVSATSAESNDAVNGVPRDIRSAACIVCGFMFDISREGRYNVIERKKSLPAGQGTLEMIIDQLPPVAKEILDRYKRMYL